jgi:squalene-associated FAD-dependent desaturase
MLFAARRSRINLLQVDALTIVLVVTVPTESRIAVIGGGLAGIAAAAGLGQAGCQVLLLEARGELGGRATSYLDHATGESIDNCQHVSMGCCTNLHYLGEILGFASLLIPQEKLYFVAPGGAITTFAADRLPAPFHLARSFLRLPYLSWREKLLFATGVRTLARSDRQTLQGKNFEQWLREQGQSENLIRNAWELVLVSALSESLDRIDAAYAHKVFVDGFLDHAAGWRVEIPKSTLGELYRERVIPGLKQLGVEIRPSSRVTAMHQGHSGLSVVLRDGQTLQADEWILAVPQYQAGDLLPESPELAPLRTRIAGMESAPIASVHLWFDRPVMPLPHAVFVGRLSQWIFARGEDPAKNSHRYQVVISASRQLQGQPQEEVIDQVRRDIVETWPSAGEARLLNSRMITERRAVFSATPGIDELRPDQQTPIPNLQIAGDWTQTGWPATMEGAVRSGFLAAENVLRRLGRSVNLVQPGLPQSRPASWLFGRRESNKSS